MSYVNSLFVRKKTIDMTEGSKRRSIMISLESSKVKELQDLMHIERLKGEKLEESIRKAEESYKKKTEEYEKQIKELREQIMQYRLHPTPTIDTINKHIEEAETLHKRVLAAINDFKVQIDKQIKDQEIDSVKRFDLKLAKICNEIDDRKKKRIMELSSMANTEKKVLKDLDTLRESAIIVEKKNMLLEEENKYLEQKIKLKDEEFQDLMQEYYYARRKIRLAGTEMGLQKSVPQTPRYTTYGTEVYEDKTERYELIISKLRKQLEIERKNLKAIRSSFAEEIDERSEMENIVKRLVEEIRIMQGQRGRVNSYNEERAILIDMLLNSTEVCDIINKSNYQSISRENLDSV